MEPRGQASFLPFWASLHGCNKDGLGFRVQGLGFRVQGLGGCNKDAFFCPGIPGTL